MPCYLCAVKEESKNHDRHSVALEECLLVFREVLKDFFFSYILS